jgi:hypothetical protein
MARERVPRSLPFAARRAGFSRLSKEQAGRLGAVTRFRTLTVKSLRKNGIERRIYR